MKLTKEVAELIDDFLTTLRDNNERHLTLQRYIELKKSSHSLEYLRAAIKIILPLEKIHGFDICSQKDDSFDRHNDLEGFLLLGGVTAIWKAQDEEDKSRDKVDTVNSSVLTTNRTVKITSIATGVATIITMIISINTCNKASDVNLINPPQYHQELQQILQKLQTKDTMQKKPLLAPASIEKKK
ncbi:MAG TPA: hypothetical protein VHB48_21505 [Chitinophagaceae bacterium]|nr:hypothetical protein [Chitinophagaceae bacterium]